MTDNTSRTLTDDSGQRELHTEDLVASGRTEPVADRSSTPAASVPAASTPSTTASTGDVSDDPRRGASEEVDRDAGRESDRAGSSGTPAGTSSAGNVSEQTSEETGTPLVGDVDGYRRRWEAVQTGFVDEPRRAVENADALVAEVITELATSFAQERGDLEGQWSKGDQVSTEDLRVSLRRYRSFFDRLLSA